MCAWLRLCLCACMYVRLCVFIHMVCFRVDHSYRSSNLTFSSCEQWIRKEDRPRLWLWCKWGHLFVYIVNTADGWARDAFQSFRSFIVFLPPVFDMVPSQQWNSVMYSPRWEVTAQSLCPWGRSLSHSHWIPPQRSFLNNMFFDPCLGRSGVGVDGCEKGKDRRLEMESLWVLDRVLRMLSRLQTALEWIAARL